MDALRDKYGEQILRRAKFTNNADDHMAGGLDRARRTGITKPLDQEVPEHPGSAERVFAEKKQKYL